MIRSTQGDILRDESEAIVNTVNCVGVMGRGIALQFRNAYPENFKAYANACQRGEVRPGRMFVTETGEFAPRYIVNFPTKRHWRGQSRMEDIEAGLDALAEFIREKRIRSIALPPLGAGLGGLIWEEVKGRIVAVLGELEDVEVCLYEPTGPSRREDMMRNRQVPRMTPGRAALVELMQRYLGGLLDPMITLLEVHKLMYFMQEAGEPLRLRFRKAPYGPFAENLGHVLKRVEGHLVSGYADGGDSPTKILQLVPGAQDEAREFLRDDQKTARHLERVFALIEGFESSSGMELLSTVHWVATRERPSSVPDLVGRVHQWNKRKQQFTPRQIELATRTLAAHGWIQGSAPPAS